MAGLWDGSTKEDRTVIESCAVITLPANEMMNVIQKELIDHAQID